jgi:trk system potassium uptake protein TrkH
MGMEHLGGLVRTVRRIAIFTILVEGAGALILFIHFLTYSPPETALWRAVFHSISAFNNAGLDIFGNFRSLLGYQTDATVLLTMAVLIILGGIGYLVVEDVFKTRSFDRLSLDSKLVLTTTFSLLALGTVFFLLAEFSNPATTGPLSLPHKLLVAFFQSVTPRTAGFTAIDVGKMVVPSLFFTMFLMFVGGASGSTAGGVKVGTLGLLSATVLSSLRGKEHAGAFGREFNFQNIQRGLVLVILYLGFAALLVLVLSITEGKDFVSLLFETFSALGTVGLSTGITPELSTAGRLIIVLGMFVGRLGPLALIVYLTGGQQPAKTHFPQELVRTG